MISIRALKWAYIKKNIFLMAFHLDIQVPSNSSTNIIGTVKFCPNTIDFRMYLNNNKYKWNWKVQIYKSQCGKPFIGSYTTNDILVSVIFNILIHISFSFEKLWLDISSDLILENIWPNYLNIQGFSCRIIFASPLIDL